MHPPAGVSLPRQESSTEALAVDLQIVDSPKAPRTNGAFRRTITTCEVVADLLVIVSSITFGYNAYYHLALGKHIHYEGHSVLAAAFGLAIVMVLMLDRAGAYSRGNSLL